MRRIAWLLTAIALLAVPGFAQDDGDGGFNVNDLFDNNDTPQGQTQAIGGGRVDVLVDLKSWLAKASAPPLEKKQEKPLQKVYDKEVKIMEKSFEKQFGVPLASAVASQSAGRGRGGGRPSPEQTAEVRRLSDQLMNKVIAALRIDQQAALRRYQSEQLRVQRLNLITQSMSAAGLPLTAEQKQQVEALYARESKLRTLIIVEAKGQPHGAKVSQLEAQTTQSVVRLMNQTQKTALAQVMAKSRTR